MRVLYLVVVLYRWFFFKHKTAYEGRISDWSSDLCSSDLTVAGSERLFRIFGKAGFLEFRLWAIAQDVHPEPVGPVRQRRGTRPHLHPCHRVAAGAAALRRREWELADARGEESADRRRQGRIVDLDGGRMARVIPR